MRPSGVSKSTLLYIFGMLDSASSDEYFFYEEQHKRHYEQESQTRQLMLILTFLILFVTALGLYGLASYATQERMKEQAVSIRDPQEAVGVFLVRV